MYTLGDFPRKWSKWAPDRECLVCYSYGEHRFSWREFNSNVNRLANALLEMGLKKGDHLAILMENCYQFLQLYFAAFKTGIVPVPLNYRLAPREMLYIIDNSDAVGFVVGPEYIDLTLKSLKPELKKIKYYISLSERVEGMTLYEELIDKGSPAEPNVEVDEDDLALLLYTGGTTGLPKGCMLTHRNLMTAVMDAVLTSSRSQLAPKGNPEEDTTLFILPMFHISLWPILMFFFQGYRVVNIKRIDIGDILEKIEKEKVTHMNAVPTIFWLLVNHPDVEKYDLSSIKAFSWAGAPMPTELLKQCIDKLSSLMTSGFGATEGIPWCTLLADDYAVEGPEEKVRRLRSVGKETMLSKVRVVNPEGKDVNPGEVGEVIVKSKSTMVGYWKNPELTKQAIRDGWLYTGDMGTVDEGGYIYLLDRKADMIKSGGERVYPFEVENVLYMHPAIAEASVIGVPDPKWGEAVKAVIYLKAEYKDKNKKELEKELIDLCHEHIAGYKCPKSFDFTDSPLPKSLIGKVLRRQIREKYQKR
ncbi:MAG: class I adenylate-forming enzyme family protein [Candidatus Jordarchaeum sp.]|uniref:class I adenylate-forming enzyme family protein n=1 Tax=Candidatus Jordarchaeum sp. TaxID=2823881 RepID=UPI00404A5953